MLSNGSFLTLLYQKHKKIYIFSSLLVKLQHNSCHLTRIGQKNHEEKIKAPAKTIVNSLIDKSTTENSVSSVESLLHSR